MKKLAFEKVMHAWTYKVATTASESAEDLESGHADRET